MKEKGKSPSHWLGKNIRRHFLAGILVVVPLGAAIAVLAWVFVTIDNILQPLIRAIFGQSITGVGFVIVIVLIYITGVFANNFVGRRLINFGESILTRVPVFRQLYTSFKQVLESLSGANKAFREVVLVEFPRPGMRTIAFITNELVDKSGKKLLTIYVPTAPNPTSGWLQIVTEDMVTRTDMSVNEAMKMVISSGMVSPAEIDTKVLPKDEAPKL